VLLDELAVDVAVVAHGIDPTTPPGRFLSTSGEALSDALAVVGASARTAGTAGTSMRLGLTSSTLGTTTCSTPSSVDASIASASHAAAA
jgi:hypothetical protein